MATLATGVQWGTQSPAIYFDISYTATRSGANMAYTINVDFHALSSDYGRYFGYPIYLDLSLDGVSKVSHATVKNASPGNWSANQVYYHSSSLSVAKTTGTVSLVLKIYSGEGSSRSQTYTYSLPVSPAASTLSLPSAGFTIGSAGSISITRHDSSFTDTVAYSVGTASGTITTISSGGSTSFSWTPAATLYSQMGGATSKTGTITVTTKSGTTTVGTNTYTFSLKGSAPSTLSLPSGGFTVNTSGSISVTRNNSGFTDTITYTLGGASGTIATISSGSSTTKTWTPPATLYLEMVGLSSKAGTIKIVTKSGSTTVGSKTYNFTLNAGSVYNPPTVKVIYQRGNGSGSSFTPTGNGTTLKVTATITVYGGQTASYTLKLDGTTKDTASGLSSGQRITYITDVTTQASHTLEATLTDALGSSASYRRAVSTEKVPMNINVDLPGVGFGKLAEEADVLDTTWEIHSTSNVRGKSLEALDTTANAAQVRYRFSDKNNAPAGNAFVSWGTNGGGRFTFREYSAAANGNLLEYYENYYLPDPEQGLSANANYSILTTKSNAHLSQTYTSNSYVTSASFGNLSCYRRAGLYIIGGMVNLSTAMPTGTDWTAIGSFGSYSALYSAAVTVPSQNGSGAVAFRVDTSGVVSITNTSGSSVSGILRVSIVAPTV